MTKITFFKVSIRSKEKQNDVIIIEKDSTKRDPQTNQGGNEYSIMFYYTPEFGESNDFGTMNELKAEYFEELVQKTNLEYQNRNIPIRARMLCFEKATIRENVSKNMSGMLELFKNMKGTPEKLRFLADVAVLITNDVKDSCGASYGHAYR